MSNGFTAEEFEPDAVENTASDGASDTTAKVNGSDGGNTTGGNNAGNASTGDTGNTKAGGDTGGTGNTARPVLGAAAYHGLAGEVVNTIAPQTEADPVALLLQFLIYGGNAIGRGPYFQVGKDRHYTNLFGLLVGDTAKARKGLSAGHIRDFYMTAVPEWAGSCIRTGMSSGEGIIHHIRDPVLAMRKGKLQTIDPGVDDKRLLIDEREFQQALTVMQRQGNTLSTVVRDAWDCRQVLETLTKKEPTKATKPFLSIGGHITLDELKESLDRTAMANGYANRFLMAFIHRSKELPLGGDDVDLTGLIERARVAIDGARGVERVNLTDGAKQLWCEIYPVLSAGQPGLLGAITARAEAQTMRLALIYALLDGVGEIDRVHIQAGLAMWAYCEASARYIFGDLLGNKTADAILATLRRRAPSGLTRSEISDVFGRNRSSGDIFQALELLLTSGKARFVTTPSGRRGGRPLETWYAT